MVSKNQMGHPITQQPCDEVSVAPHHGGGVNPTVPLRATPGLYGRPCPHVEDTDTRVSQQRGFRVLNCDQSSAVTTNTAPTLS